MSALDLTFKVTIGEKRLGHGKIELLEHIAREGSISAGARRMRMSYKRAWDLVEEMNEMFGRPVLVTQSGGKNGGGASLSETGQAIVAAFRSLEGALQKSARSHLKALEAQISTQKGG